jgi:hypothetical protein
MSSEGKQPERPVPLSRKPIIRLDGFVRKQTESVDVETLHEKGVTRIQYLTFSKINDLISLAVQRAFEKYQREWDRAAADEITEDARAEIDDALHRRAPGSPELLERQALRVGEEVRSLAPLVGERIDELRGAGPAADPVLAAIRDEGLTEMERTLRRSVGRAIEEARSGGAADGAELERVERTIQSAVRRMLDSERSRTIEMIDRASDDKTQLLERRLHKLQRHLAEMEETLRGLAEAKGLDPGIPSIYRQIQGLRLEESQYEKKKGMLKLIFEENIRLQKKAVIHE